MIGNYRSFRGLTAAVLLPLLGAFGCVAETGDVSATDPEVTGTSSQAIRNGFIEDPWGSPPSVTRAIVHVNGCTGTIVSPEWVVSATHCNFGLNATITNSRPTGDVVRGVDRIVKHPTIDAVMLHVTQPWPNDIPVVDISSLPVQIGGAVASYGYGYKKTNQACSASAPACSAGDFCETINGGDGWCMTPSAELRFGDLTVIGTFEAYYQTSANSYGQTLLPGDSGGPSFRLPEGVLLGIHNNWHGDLNGAQDLDVSKVREFILRTIKPAVRADYTGDGRSDFVFWRPENGRFYIGPAGGGASYNTKWGEDGDFPVLGDYDGDGTTDLATFRQSDGKWRVKRSSDGEQTTFLYGSTLYVPVPGDYDGDGKADYAVRNKGSGIFYVTRSSDGEAEKTPWGTRADVAVPADYDHDGRTDYAYWRPSDGNFHIKRSSDGVEVINQWGQSGDVPVSADYDGDGFVDPAVWRPSDGKWYFLGSTVGATSRPRWGQDGDVPTPGDYDGDGKADYAIFRPSEGKWYYIYSSTGGAFVRSGWGTANDVIVPKTVL